MLNPGAFWLICFGVCCVAVGEMIGAHETGRFEFWMTLGEIVVFGSAVLTCLLGIRKPT